MVAATCRFDTFTSTYKVLIMSERSELPDFLAYENEKNQRFHRVYEKFLQRAVGPCTVIVAHHITFMEPGKAPVELASADTMMFNTILMKRAFGINSMNIMMELATTPVGEREIALAAHLDTLDQRDAELENRTL
jgi:hypothetical protein